MADQPSPMTLARQLIQRGIGAMWELQVQQFRELAFSGIGHRDPPRWLARQIGSIVAIAVPAPQKFGRDGDEAPQL